MKLVSTTTQETLAFFHDNEENKQKFRVQSGKIAWVNSQADEPGAKFDLTIRDGFGGIKYQKKDFGSETDKYGELINIPTLVGEEVEVIVENIRGAKKVNLFMS